MAIDIMNMDLILKKQEIDGKFSLHGFIPGASDDEYIGSFTLEEDAEKVKSILLGIRDVLSLEEKKSSAYPDADYIIDLNIKPGTEFALALDVATELSVEHNREVRFVFNNKRIKLGASEIK